MPDLVIAHITALANSQGYERGLDPEVGPLQLDDREDDYDSDSQLPTMMAIDGRADGVHLADNHNVAADAGVNEEPLKETLKEIAVAAVVEEAASSEAEIISSVGGQPESEKVIVRVSK